MMYAFDFSIVPNFADDLVTGTWLTIRLTVSAIAIGLAIAVLGALGKTAGPRPIRLLVGAYVEIVRNTPFLVQIFIVFFGLPTIGLRMSADTAALVAMSVNVGAYATEIVRAGIESINRGQIEAGLALGLKRLQIFWYIVFRPAMRAIYPALTSQFILLMLGSSVVSTISANDLTSVANTISTTTFRSFEVYIVATIIYLILALGFSAIFALISRLAFSYPDRR